MTEDCRQAMAEKYRTILLIGPPGSGKGTQGRILGEVPNYWFVSMGELLRSLNTTTEPSRQVQQHLRRGELVTAQLVIYVWTKYMNDLSEAGLRPQHDLLVLDGLPRSVEQAKLHQPHVQVERGIHLACDDQSLLIERIRSRNAGRQDDANDDVIHDRFHVYREQTAPLLDDQYLGDKVTKIDATASPLRVLHEIVRSLVLGDKSQSEHSAATTARLARHSENLITPTYKERNL